MDIQYVFSVFYCNNSPVSSQQYCFFLLFVFFHSQPLDVVLGLLGDELDSLQDVGYVVDASLLDIEDLRGPVQIHHAVGRLGQQVQKALGGQVQGRVVT